MPITSKKESTKLRKQNAPRFNHVSEHIISHIVSLRYVTESWQDADALTNPATIDSHMRFISSFYLNKTEKFSFPQCHSTSFRQ